MSKKIARYCGLDLETTGLNPLKDLILEVGISVRNADLEEIYQRSFIVRHSDAVLKGAIENAHEKVFEMHNVNGLWQELFSAPVPVRLDDGPVVASDCLEAALLQAANHWTGDKPRLFGFNPFFDYRFLAAQAPQFLKHVHYGLTDCSTLRELVKDVYGDWAPSRQFAHRAPTDIQEAFQYLHWFRRNVMNPHHRAAK